MRRFYIFQLPISNPKIFRHFNEDREVNIEEYVPVYTDECGYKPDLELCEELFTKFNTNHPKGFAGHSMSTSDVVMITDGTTHKHYYCDAIGFVELDNLKNFKR